MRNVNNHLLDRLVTSVREIIQIRKGQTTGENNHQCLRILLTGYLINN